MPLGTLVSYMLPRWFLLPLVRLAGTLSCRLDTRRREAVIRNLRHIMGPDVSEKQLQRTARNTFINLATNYLDLLRTPVLKRRTQSLVQLDSINHLDAVLEQGRGAIMVTAHMGNWDLAGVYLSSLGYPLSAVVEPVPAGWGRTFDRYRSITGLETIPIRDRSAMARALRRRRVFTLVADRDLTGNGLLCPAFDAHRHFPKGPAAYSLKYGVPILTGFLLFRTGGHGKPYHGFVEPPIDYEPTGDMAADIENLTRIIATRINRAIRKYPDQWLVFRAGWQQ